MKSRSICLLLIICGSLWSLLTYGVTAKNYDHISYCFYSPKISLDSLVGYVVLPSADFVCGESDNEHKIMLPTRINCSRYGVYTSPITKRITFTNCTSNVIETVTARRQFADLQLIDISGSDLDVLPQQMVKNSKNLNGLFASRNRLTDIPANLFSNSKLLNFVDFSNNSIRHIDPLAFEGVDSIQTLYLSFNQINRLDDHWLHVPSLTELHLSNNNLSMIADRAFEEFTSLKHLDLSNNPIGDLNVATLAYLDKLTNLSLRRTNITNIPLGSFSHQHQLALLDLSENYLKSLDFNLFLPALHDLWSLNLAQNQLTDLNGFRNDIFPNLVLLDIKNNNFKCSYLQHFISTVNWDKLRLTVDPKSTDIYATNIRGVNCIGTINSTEFISKASASALKAANDLPGQNIEMEKILSEMNFKLSEMSTSSFINFTQAFMCIILLCFLVVIIVLYRDRLVDSVRNRRMGISSNPVAAYKNNTNEELLLP